MPSNQETILTTALRLEQQPDVEETHTSLSKKLRILIRNGNDKLISDTIESAPHRNVAQIIQKEAEAISERFVSFQNGMKIELSIFAIPILVTFEDEVPETQIDNALDRLGWSGHIAKQLFKNNHTTSRVMLLPRFFKFCDLRNAPFSQIYKGALTLAAVNPKLVVPQHPFIVNVSTSKRSNIFLRYLVGHRTLYNSESTIATMDDFCTCLRTILAQTMDHHMQQQWTVHTFCTGEFHDPLYTGMWLYQKQRLAHLIMKAHKTAKHIPLLEASISTFGNRSRFDIKVGICDHHDDITSHSYLLNSRPTEDPVRCSTRLSGHIASLHKAIHSNVRKPQPQRANIFAVPL